MCFLHRVMLFWFLSFSYSSDPDPSKYVNHFRLAVCNLEERELFMSLHVICTQATLCIEERKKACMWVKKSETTFANLSKSKTLAYKHKRGKIVLFENILLIMPIFFYLDMYNLNYFEKCRHLSWFTLHRKLSETWLLLENIVFTAWFFRYRNFGKWSRELIKSS